MKMTVGILLVMIFAVACNASSTSAPQGTEVKAQQTKTAAESDKKEEDCDDKAKKPIEIKEDSISLTGNAGCTLDEAKP